MPDDFEKEGGDNKKRDGDESRNEVSDKINRVGDVLGYDASQNPLGIDTQTMSTYSSEMERKRKLLENLPQTHPEIFEYWFENGGKHSLETDSGWAELLNSTHYYAIEDPKTVDNYKKLCQEKQERRGGDKTISEEVNEKIENTKGEIKSVLKKIGKRFKGE